MVVGMCVEVCVCASRCIGTVWFDSPAKQLCFFLWSWFTQIAVDVCLQILST